MSIEYNLLVENPTDSVFRDIADAIKGKFPLATINESDNSLWIPSSSPNWIDFSIELVASGFFIVSNQNSIERKTVLETIENKLSSLGISFDLEDA